MISNGCNSLLARRGPASLARALPTRFGPSITCRGLAAQWAVCAPLLRLNLNIARLSAPLPLLPQEAQEGTEAQPAMSERKNGFCSPSRSRSPISRPYVDRADFLTRVAPKQWRYSDVDKSWCFENEGRELAERLWFQMVKDNTTKKRLHHGETLCQMPTEKWMMAHFASWDTLPAIQNIFYEQGRAPLWPTRSDAHNFRYQMFVRWANPPA